jgi:hypothetical protein
MPGAHGFPGSWQVVDEGPRFQMICDGVAVTVTVVEPADTDLERVVH